MDKVKFHSKICDFLNETYKKKNNDYGDSFHQSILTWGISAAGVRISDKYNRLVSLLTKNKEQMVADESVADTLLDLANYCIMTYMEIAKDLDDGGGFK